MVIISSSHRFMFPAIFIFKYKTQSAGSRASEMVLNGSRFWNVVAMDYAVLCNLRYFDTRAIALGGEII